MFNLQAIAMVGATSHIIARTFFGLAETPTGFYIGGAVSSLGCVALPIIKSMISKMVEASEKGKVFAWVSVFSNSVQFFSGVIYSRIYILTIGGTAGIFWFTLFTQIVVFLLMVGYEIGEKYFKFEDEPKREDEMSSAPKEAHVEYIEGTEQSLLDKNEKI
ncbi:hypothetical protein HA402_003861 [Bradysia odoriphaga]|nr:hypothetical protein HA402_003861 [Bradysia odoriphaga]